MQATVEQVSTRDRILKAAAEVFAERGYEGAAVSDIARRAGFTTGAIYGRFRDKAELLLEVVRGVLESQQDAALLAALRALVADAQARGEVASALDPTTVAILFLAIPLGIVLLDAAGVEVPGAETWAEVASQTAASLRPQPSEES